MTDHRIEQWAELLTGYCLRVEPGETILIAAELQARPLIAACYRAIVRRGAYPLTRLELPGLNTYFLNHASDDLLEMLPRALLAEAEHIDRRIRIAAENQTESGHRADPARQARLGRAHDPIRRALMKHPWVITQFPTPSYARQAGMELPDYEDFVAAAMFLDDPDPAASWIELGRRQQALLEFFETVREIQIQADGTDLRLSVDGRTWINSDGRRNMPSGEIFTCPLESSAQGVLRCAFPVIRGGRELSGIALEFRDGQVVLAHADEGADYLLSMLDLDPGARRLGELGIGLNAGIQQFTGSILFDEKIGGTVHVALGQSYPETGGTNTSALHWDLIIDLRAEGRLIADGRVVQENGRWLIP